MLNSSDSPIYVQGGAVLYARTSISDNLEGQYLKTYFETPNAQHYFETASAGGTMKHFTLKPSQEMPIKLPQMKEQKKIGSFFSELDTLITLHQSKCYGRLRHAFLNTTISWEQRKLSDLVDVCSGMDYKHLSIGNIPVFGTGGYMLSVDKALSYDRDAIGIGRKGTIDKPYILKAPFWTVDTLFYCIPRDEGTLNFDYDLFQCIDWKQKDESTGVPSLSKVAINDTDVIVPKTEEQKKIGYFFEELDLVITLHQKQWFILKKLQFSPGSNSPVAA